MFSVALYIFPILIPMRTSKFLGLALPLVVAVLGVTVLTQSSEARVSTATPTVCRVPNVIIKGDTITNNVQGTTERCSIYSRRYDDLDGPYWVLTYDVYSESCPKGMKRGNKVQPEEACESKSSSGEVIPGVTGCEGVKYECVPA